MTGRRSLHRLLAGLLALLLSGAAQADGTARLLPEEEAARFAGVGRVNVAGLDRRGMCTGTLIAPDLVLTAAHCVVNRRTGRVWRGADVHFVAGWRKGKWLAHATARHIAVHPAYAPGGPPDAAQIAADLALIRLATPVASAEVTSFTIGTAPEPAMRVVSYRRDRAHALSGQDCAAGRSAGAVQVLACDVTFGASGAPVFTMGTEVVAVLSAASAGRAYAVRLDHALGPVKAALAAME